VRRRGFLTPSGVLAAFVLVGLLLEGCGGGSGKTTSKAEFIAQADAICAQAKQNQEAIRKEVNRLNTRSGPRRLRRQTRPLIKRQLRLSREELVQLRNLTPPPGDRAVIARYLRTRARYLALAREIHAILAKLPVIVSSPKELFPHGPKGRKFTTLSREQLRVYAREHRIGRAYGFKVCSAAALSRPR
jgi:hypothetical protein